MKIVCLGSLNMDHVYTMKRFVKAGETVAALERKEFCGGKGLNQSVALSKAGCRVRHAGRIGRDGAPLLAMLRDNNVDVSLVETVDAPTGHAIIQVEESGQNCIIIYGGANACIDEAFIDRVYASFQAGDIVLLQNEISSLPYAIRRAHSLGLRVALNPSPMTDELAACPELAHVTWFLLNETEGQRLTGEEEPEAVCAALCRRFPGAGVLLTLGEQGCLYAGDGQLYRQPIFRVPVVDTTAAGDTFTGYFLAGICEGMPIPRVLELASKASAMAVAQRGAAASIPWRGDVEAALLDSGS